MSSKNFTSPRYLADKLYRMSTTLESALVGLERAAKYGPPLSDEFVAETRRILEAKRGWKNRLGNRLAKAHGQVLQ